MVSDRNSVLYACISKGNTVLAEFSSGDVDLQTKALRCLEKAPDYHITYTHTIRQKIYSFLMADPFVYFAIVNEEFGHLQSFQFLDCVKQAFSKILERKDVKRSEILTSHCFHEEFIPIFRSLMESECKSNELQSSVVSTGDLCNDGRNSRSKHSENLRKKKHSGEMDDERNELPIVNKVDSSCGDSNSNSEFSTSLLKSGSYMRNNGYLHAKKMWRRHVWTVLLIDLMICCVLFGVWLWICRGFECIAS
ncbi:hypothetical protein MKW94_000390 [Papaver nudicaule]|uniref:Longin domain-containing protein n=1 Tax=Papaver nudicaule TaxID=74823 RepID=A0AA42AR23_PAPNU|nr:hypothetical protein [Papaver nudicaule]